MDKPVAEKPHPWNSLRKQLVDFSREVLSSSMEYWKDLETHSL
jgi:hypothetical protein